MWPLISVLVRIAVAGYVLYKVWIFLIAKRCGGYWERLFSAERLEHKYLQHQKRQQEQSQGKQQRQQQPSPSSEQEQGHEQPQRREHEPPPMPHTPAGPPDPMGVVGPSKTVYITAMPIEAKPQSSAGGPGHESDVKPQPKAQEPAAALGQEANSGSAPETKSESQPETQSQQQSNADSGQQTVASTPLETLPQSDNDDGFDSDGIETTTRPVAGSDYVDEEDLPPADEPGPGEMTSGMLIEDIENAADAVKGVVTGAEAEARAAETLYTIGQSGVVEYEQGAEQMQAKVVALLEKYGYPSGSFSRWRGTDEEFRATIFG